MEQAITTKGASAPLKASPDFSKTLAKWLAIFSEMCDKPVSEILAEVYGRALRDLTVEQLEAACIAVVRTHQAGRLPLPGDILAKVEGAKGDVKQLEAERAWQELQYSFVDWGYDESTGWFTRKFHNGEFQDHPEFCAAIEYAVRQCGGLGAVIYCADKNFPFVRRDFIAAYMRYTETAGLQMVGKAESRAILGKIRKGLPTTE